MESKIIILAILASLTGCSFTDEICKDKYQVVKVPVFVKPENTVHVVRPVLVSDKVNYETDGYDVIVRALEVDLEKLINYSQDLEKALEVYGNQEN